MELDFLMSVFSENASRDAIIFEDQIFSYQWLLDRINEWDEILQKHDIHSGTVVGFVTSFSSEGISAFFSLLKNNCIVAPLPPQSLTQNTDFGSIAQIEKWVEIDENGHHSIAEGDFTATHEYYVSLRGRQVPGLVLFSSGSTGESKAIVHDVSKLLLKYKKRGKDFRTLVFLSFDHIGGIDTLLYILSNGSCAIVPQGLSADEVCQTIEKHHAQVLPTNPAFINLLLMGEAYLRHDLSSLKYITYGAEVMPELTLQKLNDAFPEVRILQKYGTSEVGTLRSKSKNSNSLWVKIGGEGYQTRVIDGLLQIKADSAMLGYLNAPSPFTEDGWFKTGDEVIVDGEYYKILGRKSDIINVGGEKVYPSEVENVIMEVDNVEAVAVFGEPNAILGNIVCARVKLISPESKGEIVQRIKAHCGQRLEKYKRPIKIILTNESVYSARYKVKRR